MGRTGREWPGPPHPPDRPPGHPSVVAFDPSSLPPSRDPSPAAATFLVAGATIHNTHL